MPKSAQLGTVSPTIIKSTHRIRSSFSGHAVLLHMRASGCNPTPPALLDAAVATLQMKYLPVVEKDTVLRVEVFDHDAVNVSSLASLRDTAMMKVWCDACVASIEYLAFYLFLPLLCSTMACCLSYTPVMLGASS